MILKTSSIFSTLAALFVPNLGPSAESIPEVIIDRIEILGITQIESSEVEGAIEVSSGELLDKKKVVKSAENLRDLYSAKGFEKIKIQSELVTDRSETGKKEMVLKVTVTEGLPTRISKISLVPSGVSDIQFERYWKKMEASAREKVLVNVGDALDQEKVSQSKRAVQELFGADEFVGARVDQVTVTPGAAPTLSDGKELKAADRWVELEFKVELGERVEFGFRGNRFFTWGYLSSVISEARVIGLGRDYVQLLTGRLLEEYRNAGFFEVSVHAYPQEKLRDGKRPYRYVSFEIKEGNRFVVEQIKFEGNVVFSSEKLKEEFFNRAPLLVQYGFYVEKEIDKAAELLIEWLKSQGYLSSKLITVQRTKNPRKSAMQLTVYLFEGDQTIVRSIQIEGAKALSVAQVSKITSLENNAPLNLFALSEGLENLKAQYKAQGYLDFKIGNEKTESVVRYSSDHRKADVRLELIEGPAYRVSRIDVAGLQKTREEVVRREVMLSQGDVIEEAKLIDTEARLRRLGIFATAGIQLMEDVEHPEHKIIRVIVQEGTPGLVAGGVGFRNDLGARVFAQGSYSNIWHRNHSVLLNLAVNRRFDEQFCSNARPGQSFGTGNCFIEGQAQLGYVWPWFLGLNELTFRPRIVVERTQYRSFDADSIAFIPIWERKILRNPNLTGVFTYTLERVKQYHAQDLTDNGEFTLGSITPGLFLDLRDKPLAPTKGIYSSISYEIAEPIFLTQSEPVPLGYTRLLFRTDGFIPIGSDIHVYLSFRTGYEKNTAPIPYNDPDPRRYQIPISKQFTLGGAGSIRGFKEQEINVSDVAVLDSLSYVNYRAQIDLPFRGPLRFGPFLDAGNLHLNRYSLGILRYGAGVGFHYQSPVGPVNFDWGFKLDPKPNEDSSQFYFSIGVI